MTVVSAIFVMLGFLGLAAPAGAQTTTTIPPVRSIPITSASSTSTTAKPAATTTTTTTAPASVSASGTATADPLASTGIAADKLVPLAFLLIGLGAALVGAARRFGRPVYTFL